MKLKCIDTRFLVGEGIYQGLSVGKEYIVLAIEVYDNSTSSFSKSLGDFVIYRIKDNDGLVKPFPSKLFEITSSKMPSIWEVHKGKNELHSILPITWTRNGFWDDYYNDDSLAIEVFQKAEHIINAEEP